MKYKCHIQIVQCQTKVLPNFLFCFQKWPTLVTQGKIGGQGVQVGNLTPKSSTTQQSFLNQKTYFGANSQKKSPLSTATIWIHVSFYNPQYPVASYRSLIDMPMHVSVSWKGVKINCLFIYTILCMFLYILHHIPPYSLFQAKQFWLNESLLVRNTLLVFHIYHRTSTFLPFLLFLFKFRRPKQHKMRVTSDFI